MAKKEKTQKISNKNEWKKVLNSEQIERSLTRISYEILEKNGGAAELAIVGIRLRGDLLASRLCNKLEAIENTQLPHGVVDISLYRDDVAYDLEQPLLKGTDLAFPVQKKKIILVDDVLFTGRTIRAALDAIIDFGRPLSVQLAVLCDRGYRELPIRPDYVGNCLATARNEKVVVRLDEEDEEEGVFVRRKNSSS